MTINHVLYYLEWLQIDKELKFKKYLQLCRLATSPQSSLHNDGLPRARDPHARERMLTESSEALKAYYAAANKYDSYRDFLESNFSKLDFSYRVALETKYIWNLRRPREQRINGIARDLGMKRVEVPALVNAAKAQLREVLQSQGFDVE